MPNGGDIGSGEEESSSTSPATRERRLLRRAQRREGRDSSSSQPPPPGPQQPDPPPPERPNPLKRKERDPDAAYTGPLVRPQVLHGKSISYTFRGAGPSMSSSQELQSRGGPSSSASTAQNLWLGRPPAEKQGRLASLMESATAKAKMAHAGPGEGAPPGDGAEGPPGDTAPPPPPSEATSSDSGAEFRSNWMAAEPDARIEMLRQRFRESIRASEAADQASLRKAPSIRRIEHPDATEAYVAETDSLIFMGVVSESPQPKPKSFFSGGSQPKASGPDSMQLIDRCIENDIVLLRQEKAAQMLQDGVTLMKTPEKAGSKAPLPAIGGAPADAVMQRLAQVPGSVGASIALPQYLVVP